MAHSKITTVLLDADGVVQTTGTRLLSSLASLCDEPGKRPDFLSDVFAAEGQCLTGSADFPAALEEVLSRWSIETSLSEALELWSHIDPASEILDTVHSLRRVGIRVGLATNQQAHRGKLMAANLGYCSLFDDLFFSYELGVAKPDSRFFTEILGKLRVPAKNVLFIDDRPDDVSSARHAGFCGEVYHLDQGQERFQSILEGYSLYFA